MSWSVDIIGKPDDVIAVIQQNNHIPQPLKDTIKAFAEAGAANGTRPGLIRVESSGHYHPNSSSNISILRINPIQLVTAPSAPGGS